jgi:hypothetical protein
MQKIEQKLKTAKMRVLLFMLDNDTRGFNNEKFIIEFRKITQNFEIASETITRCRRYRRTKSMLLSRTTPTEEIEEGYKNNFSSEYSLDYKKV